MIPSRISVKVTFQFETSTFLKKVVLLMNILVFELNREAAFLLKRRGTHTNTLMLNELLHFNVCRGFIFVGLNKTELQKDL